jgi:hypothetical protein
MSMATHDPLGDELRAMFAHYQGPIEPIPTVRRSIARRRLLLVVGLALLLVGASAASARQAIDIFGGQPASQQIKDQIAAGSRGAPPDLDPGIEADKAVTMISIATAKGTVSLIASPARRATYCMGLKLSWEGGAGLGCNGPRDPATPLTPIDVGQEIPGKLGSSPIYVYGRINNTQATNARLELADGSHRDLKLTSGYFLAELASTAQLARVEAIDTDGTILDQQAVPALPHEIAPTTG